MSKSMKTILTLLFGIFTISQSYAYDIEIDSIYYNLDKSNKTASVTYNVLFNENNYIGVVKIPNTIIVDGKDYSVTSISYSAFSGCKYLISIEIPNSVTKISSNAFKGCTSLSSATFLDGDKKLTIEDYYCLFSDCPLETAHLGRNLSYWQDYSPFNGQDKLSIITISPNVTYLNQSLFRGCSALTSIDIPNSVKTIGSYAFEGCRSLTSIVIPNNVESVWSGAFDGCTMLTSVTIADGDLTLNSISFKDSPLKKLYVGRNISWWYNLSQNKKELTDVIIGDKVTLIGDNAFSGCESLSSIIIPKSVTKIERSAFENCISLSSIDIPNSVTEIGHSAFLGCKTLISIDIPNNITKIDESTFENCSSLISVEIPNSVTEIEKTAFNGCSALASVKLPNGVISIGDYAFEDCTSLTSIEIPNSVKILGYAVFQGCNSMTIATISDGEDVLTIINGNNSTFDGCPIKSIYLGRNLSDNSTPFYNHEQLLRITLGNKVTEINSYAFSYCPNIKEIYISSDVNLGSNVFEDNVVRTASLIVYDNKDLAIRIADSKWGEFLKIYYEEAQNRYFPIRCNEGIEFTPAFYSSDNGCLINVVCESVVLHEGSDKDLTAVFRGMNISESIKSENGFCFKPSHFWRFNVISTFDNKDNGVSTRNVIVSEAGHLLNELGMNNIQAIATLSITGNLNGTDIMTINRIPSLKYLDLTNANIVEGGVTYHENLRTENDIFGKYFFRNMENLSVILMPTSVKGVHGYAVNNSINEVVLPDKATIIGESAFRDCNSLLAVEIPNGVAEIGESAFWGCTSLISVEIPYSVASIGHSAFCDCSSLLGVEIPNGIKEINSRTFEGCSSLKSITIPSSVKEIGSGAFANCSSLTSIEIPNNVKLIDGYALSGCSSLSTVTISDGNNELEIDDYQNAYCLFHGCPLVEVYIGRNLSYHSSPFKNQKDLTKVTFGNNVTKIGDGILSGCSALSSLEIPNSVFTIGGAAFYGCSSLSLIEIPNSVTRIDGSAFSGCSSLSSIKIPNSVTRIGDSAFKGCESLSTMEIPNGVKEIERYTFEKCKSLELLRINSEVSKIGENSFRDCSALKKIVSLNPTPPAITESTFDGVDKENCQLVVTKGNLVYYWLDPYWKEFANISDDLLALNPLPLVKYGEAPVNLAEYAPVGVTLIYESSDNNVARIDGTMLTICGAGEATVSASVGADGTPMEIIGQMRAFKVDKADLTITAQSYEITQGDPLPDFTVIYNGFVYDDNANSLQKLPTIVCLVTDTSAEGIYDIGIYDIYVSDAEDPNYNINYVNGQLTIKLPVTLASIYDDSNISCIAYNGQILISGIGQSQVVNIYDVNGILRYEGIIPENGILTYRPNKPGLYLVRCGQNTTKVMVK